MPGLSPLQHMYLEHMGITRWVQRSAPAGPDPGSLPDQPAAATVVGRTIADDPEWDRLQAEVAACTRCELHRGRTHTVFGAGDRQAKWMIIGEAPGAEEDRRGEPFVGRAGQLLNSMLEAMGLERQQVFIANILKCRPPNNRDPVAGEVAACGSYLQKQIEMIQPSLILVLGRIAAQNLLKVDSPLGRMRGKSWDWNGIPVVVTYHPAYLLRNPADKRKTWQDLQLALSLYPGSP